jgi:tRNA-dihydrouridine synthase
MEASGADGVMIGRGAQGRPWLLAQVAAELWGAPTPQVPQGGDFEDMVADHYEEMLRFYGPELGNRAARKHLGWYLDEAGTGATMRKRVLTSRDSAEVLSLIPQAIRDGERAAA